MTLFRFALFITWLCILVTPDNIYATEIFPSLFQLRGYYVGVVEKNGISCYKIDKKNIWEKCSDWSYVPLPEDVALVDANSRRLVIAGKEKVRYYDEEGRLYGHCSYNRPLELTSNSQVFRGSSSTECEIFTRSEDGFVLFVPDDDGSVRLVKAPFVCDKIDFETKVFWLDSEWRIAVTKNNVMEFFRIIFKKESKQYFCSLEPGKPLVFENHPEELSVLSHGISEVTDGPVYVTRIDNRYSFFVFDNREGRLKKAKNSSSGYADIPDFYVEK